MLSTKEWVKAAELYNDQSTVILPHNYELSKGFPYDLVPQTGEVLRKHCEVYENDIRSWIKYREYNPDEAKGMWLGYSWLHVLIGILQHTLHGSLTS